jgi:hypothetical protein
VNDFTEIDSVDLAGVTGGGWKSKLAKGAVEFAKWTGIPSAIGGGFAWAKRQFGGGEQPQQPPQKPQQGQ